MTPIGVQQGGEKIAKYGGIEIIHLDADPTTTDYVLKFLDKALLGVSDEIRITDTFTAEITAGAEVSHPDKPAP